MNLKRTNDERVPKRRIAKRSKKLSLKLCKKATTKFSMAKTSLQMISAKSFKMAALLLKITRISIRLMQKLS